MSVRAGRMEPVANNEQVFGRTILISGKESLLADRAVERLRGQALREVPDALVNIVEAGQLEAGGLAEITGGSLFSSASFAVVSDLANLPAELHETVIALAKDTPSDVCLVLVHGGEQKGKGLVDKIKKAKCEVVECAPVPSYKLADFAAAEARRLGATMDATAAQALVAAVGADLRSLCAAIAQLQSDAAGERLTESLVKRYFGGRAEVTSFAVADDTLMGNQAGALEKLRWALETGAAHVLITSALASSLRTLGKYLAHRGRRLRDNEMAAAVGCPPWKLKDLARQARAWDEAKVAEGIRLVALADADVKGAAGSPDFTLERLVLALAGLARR